MRKMTKRSAIITGVAVAAVGAGATAWAAGWLVEGSGTGSADAATITALDGKATLADKIYPGAKTQILVEVDNKNEFPVKVDPASFKPTQFAVVGDNGGDCAKGLGVNAVKSTALKDNPTIPAKDKATVKADLTVGDLPQACVGKKFTLSYTFSGTSAA